MKEFKPEDVLKKDISLDMLVGLPSSYIEEKVVLGIDIYKYSQYPEIEQIYIPVIFETLYSVTVSNIIKNEPFFFNTYGVKIEDFKKRFISTGDGGFQIFDNVIQAILFAAYFQVGLRRFITGGSKSFIEKNLNKIINILELRYAISSDKIYTYKSNFYGPAIINNARILSKDNLNRLLIDINSVMWLNRTINGAENLLDIDKVALTKTNYFKDHDVSLKTRFFDESGKILSVDIQKVGVLKVKETTLDIYNFQIQAKLEILIAHQDYNIYVITIGNLNTSGINT